MATSSVARSMATFLSVALLMGSGMLASAQTVQPSNDTLPTSEYMTTIRIPGGPLFSSKSYTIAPLTENVGKGRGSVSVGSVSFSGQVTPVDYTSVGLLTNMSIAFIDCDPNGSNIEPSTTVGLAGDRKPAGIVLYSLQSQGCTLNGSYPYTTIYSMTSLNDSRSIGNIFRLFPDPKVVTATVGVFNGTGPPPGSGGGTTETVGGAAPTTAVAMSILYSITGIITLLFLVIIATGAIRAHRHPERYGPRNGFPGRPRQSRAKGLARAMLETLPIVKFGDPEPVKPGSADVELEDGHAGARNAATATSPAAGVVGAAKDGHTEEHSKDAAQASSAAVDSGLGAAQAESVKSGEEDVPNDLGCSICTEDFTTGEDVRVLPCHHKYHPACIDPWLLNVSGTCPLCRHDLRPVTSNPDGSAPAGTAGGELPPPLNEGADDRPSSEEGTPQRRRVSRFLDLNRLRHAAPSERIAALRQLREESRRAGEASAPAAEPPRRAGLIGRLRYAFSMGTPPQTNNPA